MSRVTFKTGKYSVTAGWDRPLQEFFMTVMEDEGEEEEPVWSTLFEPSMFDKVTTDHLEATLKSQLQIDASEGFWDRVNLREGNVAHFHGEGGWRKRDL